MSKKIALIAIGGNALLQEKLRGVQEEQLENAWQTAETFGKALEIVQMDAIKLLLEAGHCVIAGVGGVPVIRDASGLLVGVEAVIDKDRLSSLLAEQLGADTYGILTGVAKIALDFGKPTQRRVDRLTATEAARHLAESQFPAGSMGPKVESALNFIRSGGREVLITSPEALERLNYDTVGTRIVKD